MWVVSCHCRQSESQHPHHGQEALSGLLPLLVDTVSIHSLSPCCSQPCSSPVTPFLHSLAFSLCTSSSLHLGVFNRQTQANSHLLQDSALVSPLLWHVPLSPGRPVMPTLTSSHLLTTSHTQFPYMSWVLFIFRTFPGFTRIYISCRQEFGTVFFLLIYLNCLKQ